MLRDCSRNDRSHWPILAALAFAAVLLAPAAWSGGSGRCIITSVPDPLVLPDGSVHPAGQLRICLTQEFSPVAGLHETWLNGQPVGRFVSRTGQAEAGDGTETPFVVFRRTRGGELVLEGWADPRGRRLNTYLVRTVGQAQPEMIAHWREARELGAKGEPLEDVILLAAARN